MAGSAVKRKRGPRKMPSCQYSAYAVVCANRNAMRNRSHRVGRRSANSPAAMIATTTRIKVEFAPADPASLLAGVADADETGAPLGAAADGSAVGGATALVSRV